MAYGYPYPQSNYFNANYMPQNMQQAGQPYPQTNGAPVMQGVPDELTARNAAFPMDGSTAYFVNSAAGEIYTKQLSMVDGTLIFCKYVKATSNAPDYATKADMDALRNEIYARIGGMRNESYDADAADAGRRQPNATGANVRRAESAGATRNATDTGERR